MKHWAPIALAGLTSLFAPQHAGACPPNNNPCAIYDFHGYVSGGAPQGGVILGRGVMSSR